MTAPLNTLTIEDLTYDSLLMVKIVSYLKQHDCIFVVNQALSYVFILFSNMFAEGGRLYLSKA
jgi:hypothetical protein